ncbi:hypothetical protein [Corynebacterium pseudopelargi]|uniref:Uncharacterized protein n=1 Tax=Corynebacterium pseudopelargi TaxID=2080757 RepID=A0A3G6IUT4_9CORY|nr:hypothetical protein [Corynebacterium pseudopelargi]AZA09357.1 hypothetical protein CPPEL_06195 [Corynebacterium pseudopelargi]
MNAPRPGKHAATPHDLAAKRDPQRVRAEVEALLATPVEDAQAEAEILSQAHDVLQQALR